MCGGGPVPGGGVFCFHHYAFLPCMNFYNIPIFSTDSYTPTHKGIVPKS